MPDEHEKATKFWQGWAQQEIHFRKSLDEGGMERVEDLLQSISSACLTKAIHSHRNSKEHGKWIRIREALQKARLDVKKIRYE